MNTGFGDKGAISFSFTFSFWQTLLKGKHQGRHWFVESIIRRKKNHHKHIGHRWIINGLTICQQCPYACVYFLLNTKTNTVGSEQGGNRPRIMAATVEWRMSHRGSFTLCARTSRRTDRQTDRWINTRRKKKDVKKEAASCVLNADRSKHNEKKNINQKSQAWIHTSVVPGLLKQHLIIEDTWTPKKSWEC